MFTDTQNLEFLRNSFDTPFSRLKTDYFQYAADVLEYAESTLDQRTVYLNQFLDYLTKKNIRLADLTDKDLDLYFAYMAKRGHMRFPDKEIATNTVNTSKRSVKGFLNWCAYEGITVKVNLKRIKERKAEEGYPEILRHEDILFVIKRIENRQDRLIISVLYEAGLRIQELVDMKIEHLRGTTLSVVGKGRKHRITYLTPELVEELRAWMEANGWHDGYVFRPLMHGKEGRGYEGTDTVRQRIEKCFMKILSIEMNPHRLRHAFALKLLRDGVSLRAIQKLLGHAKIETTMIYLNIDNSYLEKEYTKSFTQTVYA